MVQAVSQRISFDEFIESYPENSEHRYELHEGMIVEMPKPTGKHSEIAGFISGLLFVELARLKLPYFIPKECIVKSQDGESGYEPDAIVLDRQAVSSEPRWAKESIITLGTSVRLVVEVVSTNWQDDYLTKSTQLPEGTSGSCVDFVKATRFPMDNPLVSIVEIGEQKMGQPS